MDEKKDLDIEHEFRKMPGLAPRPKFEEADFPKLRSAKELFYLRTIQQIMKWALETSHGTAAAEILAILSKNLHEIVGPLERLADISTCRLEDVAEIEIPLSSGTVKGEPSLKAKPSGWRLQSEPDKDCRWAGSSERFDSIATFQNEYGTKLQVTYDDKQLVLLLNTEDPTAYKMTKWWPSEVVKELASILNAR